MNFMKNEILKKINETAFKDLSFSDLLALRKELNDFNNKTRELDNCTYAAAEIAKMFVMNKLASYESTEFVSSCNFLNDFDSLFTLLSRSLNDDLNKVIQEIWQFLDVYKIKKLSDLLC